ncbi:hypothetical protein [Shewanella khirikhana]|uniref:Uncharacterized protein n=1 Tax=Shewanella khirikhana TaxID=1965282 RepID=A0ABM7DPF2_9GAMM|nr:hypothetical protein [Shewanella khirikhana]AZQ11549.1 hypothetical protein STH12_02471 [Shewanella khirikhana]
MLKKFNSLCRFSIFTLFILSFLFLINSSVVYAQTVYRASTVSFGGTFDIEPSASAFTFNVDDVDVICSVEDEAHPVIGPECQNTGGLLSSVISPQYLIHGSNPQRPFYGGPDTLKQELKIPIVNVNNPSEIYMVSIFCQQRAGSFYRCNNAGHDSNSPEESRKYIITIDPKNFESVPDGVYSASFSTTTMSWRTGLAVVNFSFNFTFRVNNPGSIADITTLYALQGNTLPLFFSRYGEDTEFGKGGLDFCLQTTDYANVSLTIVSPDPALNVQLKPDQFVLTNVSALDGDADRFSLIYRVKSLSLGKVDHASTNLPSNCGDQSFAFCRGFLVQIDLSQFPDTLAPDGGSCKRFDITVETIPFRRLDKASGQYYGSFYIDVAQEP